MKAKFERVLMRIAEEVASLSKDTTKVGAVLVGPDGELRMTAYNGPPRGLIDSPDKFVRPDKYMYAAHAEENIVCFCAREGISTRGCTVLVTHPPCASCMRKLIQAGISQVIYGTGTFQALEEHRPFVETMVIESGIGFRPYAPE